MERTQKVLNIFCKASGAKINWNKSCAIWASKRDKEWEWGREVGLQWIPKGKGVRYLGIQADSTSLLKQTSTSCSPPSKGR